MSDEPIRYAIVGLGRAGWDIHVRQLRGRADARIVAVVDPVAERRDQAAAEFGCKAYARISQMLRQDEVETVVIATPSVMHGPDTKKALRAGKHVVVEKPMALSVAEADGMIRMAEQAGRKLFVHQNYRFFPEFTYLRSIVDSGILGRLFHVRLNLNSFSRRNDWQTLSRNGGGLLNNTCPHFIDQIVQLVGASAAQVMGDLKQIASAGDVEDHVKALVRFENGCTADVEVSTAENVAVPMPKWILCGTTGTLTHDGKQQQATVRWFDPAQVPPLQAIDGPAPERKYANQSLPWQERVEPAVGPDAGSFYDNVRAVLRDGADMRITPQSVREVLRIIALIRRGTTFPGKPARPAAESPNLAGA